MGRKYIVHTHEQYPIEIVARNEKEAIAIALKAPIERRNGMRWTDNPIPKALDEPFAIKA